MLKPACIIAVSTADLCVFVVLVGVNQECGRYKFKEPKIDHAALLHSDCNFEFFDTIPFRRVVEVPCVSNARGSQNSVCNFPQSIVLHLDKGSHQVQEDIVEVVSTGV
ncbi:unnamed protein product [Dibothriocephalus latus]|uniref:Uncharacterized protein n=1 Tax=Dibothriocephalus latus TaxID=60516 RepID=A0A3P6PPI8_DIBLA|nr:unnamed protein product [Dibothriocephalus latus]